MTDFDIQATIKRIIALYRERGLERTRDDIVKYSKSIAKKNKISETKALLAIERDLLDDNPKPEKWD
jgi:hypothetical protein